MKTTNASTSVLKKEMNVLFNAVTCSDIKFNQKVIAIASSLDGSKYPTPNTQ